MCSLVLSAFTSKVCNKCSLPGNRIVWGYGNYKNRVIFIGEAPGAEEDKLGKPFVGRSGKLLTKMLNDSGIRRELVYITNVVKCRPEKNRTPTEDEIKLCSRFLKYEIQNIKPEVIVTLGSTSTSYFLNKFKISEIAGTIVKTKIGVTKYRLYPLYHPSYVLRNGISREEYLNLFIRLRKILYKIYLTLDLRFKVLIKTWDR